MKFNCIRHLNYFILFFLLVSCNPQGENKEIPIPKLNGKIYLFEAEKLDTKNPQLTDLIFINDEDFAATVSYDYQQKYCKGTYRNKVNEVILTFDSVQYNVFFPPVKAISAVDTNEYLPIVTEEKAVLKKMVMEKGKNEWTLTTIINFNTMIGVEQNELTVDEMKGRFISMGVGFLFPDNENQ